VTAVAAIRADQDHERRGISPDGPLWLAMAPPTAYPALDCDLEFDVAVIVLRDVDDIADARAVAALAPRTRFARTLAALRLCEAVAV